MLPGPDLDRIAVKAKRAQRTVRRCYTPGVPVSDYSLAAVNEAARELGYPAPPARADAANEPASAA